MILDKMVTNRSENKNEELLLTMNTFLACFFMYHLFSPKKSILEFELEIACCRNEQTSIDKVWLFISSLFFNEKINPIKKGDIDDKK